MSNVITVNALNQYVKSLLESDPVLTDVAIRGEISSFVHHQRSGHFYFYLKDENASAKAVMFRSSASRLAFMPENGMRVVVRCRVSLYERDGAFQIYVTDMFPDGVGAAQIAFEQLKAKLEAEGLFDFARKKALPDYPSRIGLITSKSGAALQDVLSVSSRRYPLVEYVLYPVNVQGKNAEDDIARALMVLGGMPDLDVILVTRGGGTKEDLWVFNSEKIARAAAGCAAPVISAVGHEIDFTILDFVADMRAATPSAAAELALPDQYQLQRLLARYAQQAQSLAEEKLRQNEAYLQKQKKTLALAGPIAKVQTTQQMLSVKKEAVAVHLQNRWQSATLRLDAAEGILESLNPENVLKMGYALVRAKGQLMKNADTLQNGDMLQVRLQKTNIHCRVERLEREGDTHGENIL